MSRKREAEELLLSLQEEIFELGDQLFELPELGFREESTSQLIAGYLDRAGIDHEDGIAMTGIRATIGSGDYHIGLVTDLDAIAVSDNGKTIPFHSCGHSSQNTIMLAVMRVLHELEKRGKLGCKVTYLGAPAEEYIELEYRQKLVEQGKIRYYSGKQNMIRDGYFDGIDCVFCTHAMGDLTKKFDFASVLSGFLTKKVTFKGVAAHSGASPFLGKNALHGANLFMQAVSFLYEQFPYEAGIQIHPIITNGGVAMNVIPDTVVVESYVRALTNETLFSAEEKFDRAAKACAQALGLECEIESTVGYMPLRQSDALNEIVYRSLLDVCDKSDILTGTVSGASGDMGDVGFLIPTIQLGYAGYEGRIHSNHFVITDKKLTYLDTAKAILLSVLELIENPELRMRNENFQQDKQTYLDSWLSMK
ncbi:amidohydrolase [Oscillospiraceae bacterium MB08-C2-2]|nr:amidohydrolase [Oscillospiraceae bacterium MB08-C2-2]